MEYLNNKDINDLPNEKWKDVKGYEGLYQVSNMGRIRNVPHEIKHRTGSMYMSKSKIMRVYINDDGYCQISLRKNGKCKRCSVHRLVAEAFIPNPENKPTVDHINTIRNDNRVTNLRWATQKEQMENKITKNRMSKTLKENAKKVIEYNRENGFQTKQANEAIKRKVICVTTNELFDCARNASKHYNIDSGGITKCCRKTYEYCGKHPDTGEKLIWKYADEED